MLPLYIPSTPYGEAKKIWPNQHRMLQGCVALPWDDPCLSDKAVQGVHRYAVSTQLAFPLPHGNSGLQALELFAVDIL